MVLFSLCLISVPVFLINKGTKSSFLFVGLTVFINLIKIFIPQK